MIKNIGFSENATHTKHTTILFENMNAEKMAKNITHPKFIIENKDLDLECMKIRFGILNPVSKLLSKLKTRMW